MSNQEKIIDWDDYSLSFQSVMPSQMLTLNREVASHMRGSVVDYGCGAGKAIPFIVKRSEVTAYCGIDAASEMVARAKWMAGRFSKTQYQVIHATIEETPYECCFDSALSVNSYYTWEDTNRVLRHIYTQLKPGAVFVLATINRSIDMEVLLEDAELEMIAHPHWQQFKRHNLQIGQSKNLNLNTMDELIRDVQRVGLQVVEAHQKHYLGGLSFLVLQRPSRA
jgi:SAM-dependent methyltransferase